MEPDTGTSVAGRRTWVWAAAAVAGILAGIGLVWLALHPTTASRPDREELVALRSRLTEIQEEIRPIAVLFTAESTSAIIDVSAYRIRVSTARKLVDSTYDLPASTVEGREVRDLIVTGGSEVLDAFDSALATLATPDSSATADAEQLVADGVAALQEARSELDTLVPTSSR